MEQETFISGYCRALDESRMGCAVKENGILTEVDCFYETCPHATECTVAQRIQSFLADDE